MRPLDSPFAILFVSNSPPPLPYILNAEGHVWHLFVVRTIKRKELESYLNENGVQTIIHYPIPPHKQEAYKEYNDLSFPITEEIHEQTLSLPLSPVMSKKEIEMVVNIINKFK